MKSSRQHKKHRAPVRALCCSSCRLSVSSSSGEVESSSNSTTFDRNKYHSISSIAHAMIQERLDQIIREKQHEVDAAARAQVDHRRRSKQKAVCHDQAQAQTQAQATGTKFVVMVAMEKCSYDPREDFRESMAEMIMAKRIKEPKDLRSLLNYYVSMNSEEYREIILEVFHEVCSVIFLM